MTYCKKEVQKKRLMERDGISRKQTMKIIKSQMQSQEKLKYADYIIDTSSSLQSTVEQTERVYRNLMMDNEMKNSIAKYES
jgi:dephospho-CoA kinase